MGALITVFASGKGGCGKSVTAVLCGAALAAAGHRVLLVELAGAMRGLDVMTGVSDRVVFDLEDVWAGRVGPGKAVVESPVYAGLSLMPAPYSGGGVPAENIGLLCERLRYHYDHVILDTATGETRLAAAAAECAQMLVLVQTPDEVSLRCARLLADMMPPAAPPPRLLLNRVDPQRVRRESGLSNLDEAVDRVGARLIGVVPDSQAVHRAAVMCRPPASGGVEARVFAAIARRMAGEDAPLVIQ